MASLRELQASFAAALRDATSACAATPPANLAVYRNNSAITFREALERAYPVVLRRVGEDYFRQLAHFYRERFPSRSGDLHWTGREFAPFLAGHLAGGEYAWLADLAALEWAREEAGISIELPAVGVESLRSFAPEELEQVIFALQPSLRLVYSAFPIFSVWRANQGDNAPPMDQCLGAEHLLVRIRGESVEVQLIAPDVFSFVVALRKGATLGSAMTAASIEAPRLAEILAFVFGASLVCSVSVCSASATEVAGGDSRASQSAQDGQRVGTSS